MEDSFQNHIDELFRNRLQFHKKEPSKHVWENIESELDKNEKGAPINKSRTYFKKTGTTLILAFFLASMILYYRLYVIPPELSVKTANVHASESGNRTRSPVKAESPEKISDQHLYQPMTASAQNSHVVLVTSLQTGNAVMSTPEFSVLHPMSTAAQLFHPDFIAAVQTDHLIQSSNFQPLNAEPNGSQQIIHPEHTRFSDRLSVTPYFSQEFAGYNFDDDDVRSPNGKEVERAERNIFSASVGIYVNYKLSKKWMLQSGASYSWSRSIMDSSQSYAVMNASGEVAFKLNTASGFSFLHSPSSVVPMVGDSLATARTHNELHYITVPLVLSYRMPFRRFTFLAGAGVTFNMLTHATLETDIYGANFKQNESEIPLRGLKKINFGLLVKAEIQYRISSKMAFSLIPSFKNTLGPINMNNTSLRAYPYNFGIGGGIVYSF